MKKLIVILAIVLVALMASQPAFAYDYRYYDNSYQGPSIGAQILGGAIGAFVGTILMSSGNNYYPSQPYGYSPPPAYYPGYPPPTVWGQSPNFPAPGVAYCAPRTPGCRLYVQPGGSEFWLP